MPKPRKTLVSLVMNYWMWSESWFLNWSPCGASA